MTLAQTAVEFSVSKARPSKALAILPLFKDFDLDSIELVFNEAVKGYTVPLTMQQVLERARVGNHFTEKLNDNCYAIVCFGREVFTVVTSGETTTVLL